MDREQEVHFVYENGVLLPEEPVDLPEGARGVARILETQGEARRESDARRLALATIRRIGESGVFDSGGRKLKRDEMHSPA
ncbi:MAG: antitoxin family protein [Phycisphaeraceae bacterium]|nr:antitoxin family protein [Phycisphaeraceae bacterium]